MNGKMNRALAEIDESLINEAANADRAEHKALRTVRGIAIPLAAAAAVAGVAIATQDHWKAAVSDGGTSGVSLIESGDTLLPSAAPSWANADGQSRLGELLWSYDGINSVGAVPICMDGQKIADTYFASNFPNLVYVGEDIAVFTDGVDRAVYFCDISEEESGDRILYSIDLESTVLDSLCATPDLACRYSKLGYPFGGQTNGISVFAAEKDGKTGIFFNVASYDDEENRADDVYRIVYEISANSPIVIRAVQTDENGVCAPFEGWQTQMVSVLDEPLVCEDGKTVTAMLESWDFSGFCLEIEENGEQRRIYPFKTESELADDSQTESGNLLEEMASEQLSELLSGCEEYSGNAEQQAQFPLGCGVDGALFTTYFGYDEWRGGTHYGVDIGNEGIAGKPVSAAYSGRVVAVNRFDLTNADSLNRQYGSYVVISHGNGIFTVYGQLDFVCADEGDIVKQGAVIGTVGSTGSSTAAHLHFEVRNGGSAVNPLELSYAQDIAPESADYIFPLAQDSDYTICETTYAEGSYYGHSGVDIAAKKGTPIYAAQSGTVVLSEYYYGYGKCVMILHDDGRTTVYGHCDELLVSAGDVVEKGQNIATVGTTGQTTGENLHFEVRENDEPLEHPLSLIRFFP